jgi:hypothetical protein
MIGLPAVEERLRFGTSGKRPFSKSSRIASSLSCSFTAILRIAAEPPWTKI